LLIYSIPPNQLAIPVAGAAAGTVVVGLGVVVVVAGVVVCANVIVAAANADIAKVPTAILIFFFIKSPPF
jgi:hypothetical protein